MAFVWAIILMSTRKQMIVAFGLLFLCLAASWWKDKKWYVAVLSAGVIVILQEPDYLTAHIIMASEEYSRLIQVIPALF